VDEQDNISVPVPVEKLPPTSQMDSAGSDVGDQYRPVTLKECLDNFTSEEIVELTCPSCGSKDGFSKRSLFKTFPEVLAVNARRFVVINWVPTKVDVPVIVDDQPFRLDDYKSNGLSEGEELLPDNGDEPERRFTANHEAMEALEQMGFSSNRCERALHATGNNDANAAMEWLFAHMDDPDIDQPLDLHDEAVPQPVDDEKVEALGQMGFAPPQARRALKETNGDLERAVDWLFNHPDEQGLDIEAATTEAQSSGTREPPGTDQLPANFSLQSIICHKGGSIHAG
jgi:ubiquitin carboxyl-terminal hydrolase 5/13